MMEAFSLSFEWSKPWCQSLQNKQTSGTSGKWDWGAYSGEQLLQIQWGEGAQPGCLPIAAKEMLPLHGGHICSLGKSLESLSFMQVWQQFLVSVITICYSRDVTLMHMLQCLWICVWSQCKTSAYCWHSKCTYRQSVTRIFLPLPCLQQPPPQYPQNTWTSRLYIPELESCVLSSFLERVYVAQSMHRTYNAGTKRFQQFCVQYQITNPFPVSPSQETPPLLYSSLIVTDSGLYCL